MGEAEGFHGVGEGSVEREGQVEVSVRAAPCLQGKGTARYGLSARMRMMGNECTLATIRGQVEETDREQNSCIEIDSR